jgi:catechol 2,3-dioxygenase-like lactoylglutathione lyase family enzyme
VIGGRLDHVAIHVADREAASVVVKELLGLEQLDELFAPSADGVAGLRVMTDADERFHLVLCDASVETHPIARWIEHRGPGVHHLAHRVVRVEDALDAATAAGGTPVGGIVDAPGLRQVFVAVANDGVLHELTQRTAHTTFDRNSVAALISVSNPKE